MVFDEVLLGDIFLTIFCNLIVSPLLVGYETHIEFKMDGNKSILWL